MKKLFFLAALAALPLFAAEITVESGKFSGVLDSVGGAVKNMKYAGKNLFLPRNSFTDKLFSSSVKDGKPVQTLEEFGTLEWEAKETRDRKFHTYTFSGRGKTAFDWCRLTKSFAFSRDFGRVNITYKLENTDKVPHSAGIWSSTSPRLGDGKQIFFQPKENRVARIESPGSAVTDEWSSKPFAAFSAVADKSSGAGWIFLFPRDAVSAYYNWLSASKPDATLEWLLKEQKIAPGKSVEHRVEMEYSPAVAVRVAELEKGWRVTPSDGKDTLIPQFEADKKSVILLTPKNGTLPRSAAFMDLSLRRNYTDSVAGARIPGNIPDDKIGVYFRMNGETVWDRPLPFTVKQLGADEKMVLISVPGVNPDGFYYTEFKNGRALDRRNHLLDLGADTLECRIVFDKTADQPATPVLKAETPQLIYNGSFEERDQDNWPTGFNYAKMLRGKNQFFSEEKHVASGKYAFRLNRPDKKSYCTMENFFRVVPGKKYTASAKLKCDNILGEFTVCGIRFLDADGKILPKPRIQVFQSKDPFDWKTVSTTFVAPPEAVAASFHFGIYGVKDHHLYIDDLSVVPDADSFQPRSRLDALRDEVKAGNYKVLEHLEKLSFETETPHVKWFKPAAFSMPEALYLVTMHTSNEDSARRQIVEIAQRMPLTCRYIPLLREMENFPGGVFGVNTRITFAPRLEQYIIERLRQEKTPRFVIVQQVDFKIMVQPEFVAILNSFQKKGSGMLFLNCQNIPAELLGEKIPVPEGFWSVPEMRKCSVAELDRAVSFYRNGKARVGVFHHYNSSYYIAPGNFPCTPPELRGTTIPDFYGSQFPYWEYIQLLLAKSARYCAGTEPEIAVANGSGAALEISAAQPWQGTLRAEYLDDRRNQEGKSEQSLSLNSGKNAVALKIPQLPGGVHIVHYQLLNKAGQVAEAGALRFDTPETATVGEARFAASDRCFEADKPVAFSVPLSGEFSGARLTAQIFDSEKRLVRKITQKAEKEISFSFHLLPPHTTHYEIRLSLDRDGKTLARRTAGFSLPFRPVDRNDVTALMWILRPEMHKVLRDLGFDGIVSGYRFNGDQNGLFRNLGSLDMEYAPIGSGAAAFDNFKHYNVDRPTDPVRNPCFSDPAYQAGTRKAILDFAQKHNFRYYNIKRHFLSDETYLGSTVCYSPHCLAAFRKDLEKRYGTLEALNASWDSSFRNWNEVVPIQLKEIPDRKNLSRWLDHKLFMCRVFADSWLGNIKSYLNEAMPGSAAGLSGTQEPGCSYDWEALMRHIDFLSYYDGVQCKIVHDFAAPGFMSGQWGGGYTDMNPHEQYQTCGNWENLFRGANLMPHFHGNAMNGDLSPTENLKFYSNSILEMKRGVGKRFLTAKPLPDEIAILYSQPSMFAAMGSAGLSEWRNAQSGWNAILTDLKLNFRFITSQALREGKINARVLVLPFAMALGKEELAAIRTFAENGGVVIADVLPGWYDGHGKKSSDKTAEELFGKPAATPEVTVKILPAGRFRVGDPTRGIAERRSIGKGEVIVLNLHTAGYRNIELGGVGGELSQAVSGSAAYCEALRNAVRSALPPATAPQCKVETADGRLYPCTTVLRQDGPNHLFGLLKFSLDGARFDFGKNTKVKVTLPVSGFLYDVRRGKFITRGNTFEVAVTPGWAEVYSVLAEKPELKLVLPERVQRGSLLTCRIGGASTPLVYHVELLDPNGKSVRSYRSNHHFKDGNGKVELQTALNDLPGKWRCQVRCVDTGEIQTGQVEFY